MLGILLDGAQRLQQEPTTRQCCQVAGETLLAIRAEERRLLQVRKRGMAHMAGQERNSTPVVQAPDEGESP